VKLQEEGSVIVFEVDDRRHALPLAGVVTVELAAEVTPFPEAPRAVIGALAWRGRILPVLSMRRRLGLPDRPMRASDLMIVVDSSRRRLALLVDSVLGVREAWTAEITGAGALSDGLGCVTGAASTADGVILIHDLELFLTEEDEKALGNP
jgi:purine-binding chemotaxis protein CheW